MILSSPRAPSRAPLAALALVAATVAATTLAASPAVAQGTDAQREACTPDALKLCQSTIPDVDKTTACMKAHFAQLSPRCKVAFNDVTGDKPEARPARRPAIAPPPDVDDETDNEAVGGAPFATPGMAGYAAQIRSYCRDGLIDPYTCRNTLATLRGTE